jgi:hypothetical protein
MMNFLVRIVLFLLGLIVATGLLFLVLVLAAVWGLRYGWARLTGKPVSPWAAMAGRFDPRSGFDRFRAASRPAAPSAADVASARAQGGSVERPMALGDVGDVTDVRARPASRPPNS